MAVRKASATKKSAKPAMSDSSAQGIAAKFPADLKPMLATLVAEPFDEPGWVYEVKWDGYRALAYLDNDSVELRSRNNKSFNEKFYPIHQSLKELKLKAVIDGEIIVVKENGISDFGALQSWRSEADGQLIFYAFDLLWIDGYDIMSCPLLERRERLRALIPGNESIRLSETFDATGIEFFEMANEMELEGIIAKKAASAYTPDARSRDWLKIKTEKRQEVVIGGYTKNENTSKKFSALLVGIHENGKFNFLTPVGTGFSNKLQDQILEQLKPLQIPESPFSTLPEYNKPSRFRPNPPKAEVTWVKPVVVAEISYREMTSDGAIRHPSFKGLRQDKKAEEISRQNDKKANETNDPANMLVSSKIIHGSEKKERKSLLNPKDETQARKINGHELKFTNLSKPYWPEEGVSKRDMLNYYYQVSPYMLPYMKDRPQTLNRHPNGYKGKSFYQKDVKGKVPSWIDTFPYHSEADERDKDFLVCTNEASLMYIASLGCIEMNPWHSRKQNPDNPDYCIIDLDPDKHTFDQVIEAANVTRQLLESLEVPAFCKTSGSTGLHIYIPFGAKYSYEDSKEFARKIVKIVHDQIPEFTSIERQVAKRNGKMYLDFLQNRPQATVSAVYSLRPKPGATVSMPLTWEEVKKGLAMKDFTIHNAVSRIREQGDHFKGVLGKGINLPKILKLIDANYADIVE